MSTAITPAREDRTVLAIRRLAHADLEAVTLLRRVARVLHRAAPFELYSAATIDPVSNLMTAAFAEPMDGGQSNLRPVSPDWFERFYFEEGFAQTLALVRGGRYAATIAEETGGQLDLSFCYRESMRPAGITDKLHAVFVDRGRCWGDIELYRAAGSPAFTAEETSLLERISPDVATGLKLAALRTRADADAASETAPGVLIIDRRGRVTATAVAERLLASLGSLDPHWRDGGPLPVPVQVLIAALERSLAAAPHELQEARPRLRVRSPHGRWLSLHASLSEGTDARSAERIVVIAPAQSRDVAWLGMAAYGLSPREEEVVKLIVGGQTTRQISDRLFIAENTVQRHLSNIFEKVGVRGRRALVKHVFVEHLLPAMN